MLNEFYAPFILFYVAGEAVTSRRRELRPSPGSPGTPANAMTLARPATIQ